MDFIIVKHVCYAEYSVIWSGEGQFAKVTAGDALKVLHDESLTSEVSVKHIFL